jgi:hypothetical protein
MGFLDKLLGRGKDAAESAGDAAKDAGSKVTDVASDVGDKAEEGLDEAKERISGDEGSEGSDVTQAEQRLDNVRDQALRDEGRMP